MSRHLKQRCGRFYSMSDSLSSKERSQLINIGKSIISSLSCKLNEGMPCRTDRLNAIGEMIKYLKIHCYKITEENK